jgi:hypothetical protein
LKHGEEGKKQKLGFETTKGGGLKNKKAIVNQNISLLPF